MTNKTADSLNVTLSIGAIFTLIIKKAVPIMICTVAFALAAFITFGLLIPPNYTATVSIIVDNRTVNDPTSSNYGLKSTSDITASRMLTDTYIAIFRTSTFLESVSKTVNETSEVITSGERSPLSGKELGDMLSMSAVNQTELLQVDATSGSPQLCVDICHAIVKEARIVLYDTMNQPSVISVEGDNILLPTEPSSPGAFSKAIIAGALGFIVSCAAVVIAFVIKTQYTEYLPSGNKVTGKTDSADFSQADYTGEHYSPARPVSHTAYQAGNTAQSEGNTAEFTKQTDSQTPKMRRNLKPGRQAHTQKQ